MASKFSEYLQSEKIDLRRLASASQQLEKLRVEDRKIRLGKRQAKAKEGGTPEGAPAPAKPRSGRPLTPMVLRRAVEGKPVPSPAKTRLLRAVNRILEQKKKEPVDLRKLF
jgi:hypothetical protein